VNQERQLEGLSQPVRFSHSRDVSYEWRASHVSTGGTLGQSVSFSPARWRRPADTNQPSISGRACNFFSGLA
jgi:hypothetical protein